VTFALRERPPYQKIQQAVLPSNLIQLFIDEDSMDRQFIRALRARGVDVTTVGEIGTTSFSDEDQLILATEQQRQTGRKEASKKSWKNFYTQSSATQLVLHK